MKSRNVSIQELATKADSIIVGAGASEQEEWIVQKDDSNINIDNGLHSQSAWGLYVAVATNHEYTVQLGD